MVTRGVELTVESAWYIADLIGAGTFPWVLAITAPYHDGADRAAFAAGQATALTEAGMMIGGRINADVQQWIRTVCYPECWLELRFVEPTGSATDMLRGIVVHHGDASDADTVVALRNAQFVTFSPIRVNAPLDVAGLVTAGMPGRSPARFEEFTLPVRVGERADKALREGADLTRIIEYLGIPDAARGVVRAVFESPCNYVEVVAGRRSGAKTYTTEVGIAVLDTAAGRVLVSPTRAFDGEWVSTFASGTPVAIATALERLNAELPSGRWFQKASAKREFTTQTI